MPKVPSIPEASAELNMNCERPSKVEIVHSIKKLKAGKGAGPDNIPPEALKSDPICQWIFITACLERYGKNRCHSRNGIKILKAGEGALPENIQPEALKADPIYQRKFLMACLVGLYLCFACVCWVFKALPPRNCNINAKQM